MLGFSVEVRPAEKMLVRVVAAVVDVVVVVVVVPVAMLRDVLRV